jgi:hypothetical protein
VIDDRCICDCLDCETAPWHVTHDGPRYQPAPEREERDPLTPALLAERVAPITETELRAQWGDR